MQINIGDKVRFLNETGGGIVTRIIDAKTVMVLNEEDDFEIPTLKAELVVIETKSAQNNHITEKAHHLIESTSPKQREQQPLLIERDDVYLAFVPQEGEDITQSPMEVYLINDSNYILLYTFNEEIQGDYQGISAGHIDPRSKIMLKEYTNKELGELSSYLFQFIFYQKGKYELKNPMERQLRIFPVKFHKSSSYKETHYFKQRAILHCLTGKDHKQEIEEISSREIKKIISEKEHSSQKVIHTTSRTKGKDEIIEIDLHINALLDSVTGLSNADILEYQLNKFHEVLIQYKNKKGQRIVFIHGIGNGTLKRKIHEELRRKYRAYYQQDASFKEYGWGATMVTIR